LLFVLSTTFELNLVVHGATSPRIRESIVFD